MLFSWQPVAPLPAGAGYEVVWWNLGENPAAARGIAAPTAGSSVVANLDALYNSNQFTNNRIYWSVIVVQLAPYRRITQPASGIPFSLAYVP